MKFTLPFPPQQLNPNKRLHWAVKRKHTQAYRQKCMLMVWNQIGCQQLREFVIGHIGDFNVKITFHKPDNRKRDDDNIIASFKAGRDGVADALNVDDNRFVVTYIVSKENVKGGLVVIEVSK